MSAPVLYEQYISEQTGFGDYCPKARKRFAKYLYMVHKNEISMNQAYNYSRVNGDDPEETAFQGGFKEWLERAKVEGWVDRGLDVLDVMLGVKTPTEEAPASDTPYAPTRPRISAGGWVAIGLGVVGLATVIYFATRPKKK